MEELIFDEEAFREQLIKHKKLMAQIKFTFPEKPNVFADEDTLLLRKIKESAKELSLALSGFKCSKCGAEDRLSFHHLIGRKAKEFMPFPRYYTARYYWNCVIVLCWKCHKEYHDIMDGGKRKSELTISPQIIAKVKRKFYKKKEVIW